jgi:transcriptional regulator GlxA family with amidase domain
MAFTVGIFVFEDAEELDWAGPYEVLGAWSRFATDKHVRVLTIGRREGPVRCAHGLRVLPDHTLETAPRLDVVDDGDIVTSAGVSAGIDMTLRLVARLDSVERAREVRRYIQYDPEPPV